MNIASFNVLVGKVKTNIFLTGHVQMDKIYMTILIWPQSNHDIDYVMHRFQEFLFVTFEPQDLDFPVSQKQGETVDTFYNRILKICHQCEFSDPDERLIDAVIFGASIVKAQDKLLQTPKTLSLQQCLTVCRHYESLKLYIEQIRPSKSVDYLKWCHDKKKGQGQSNQSVHQSGQSSNKGSSQSNTKLGSGIPDPLTSLPISQTQQQTWHHKSVHIVVSQELITTCVLPKNKYAASAAEITILP